MELMAFSITQRGGKEGFDIFVTVLPARELVQRCIIDRWTPENKIGYQRLPEQRRLSEGRGSVVRYLMKEMGCFPTSILVNVRGEVSFEGSTDMGWCSYGKLRIEDEALWLIDGQHRVEALKRAMDRNADFEGYPVIVSLLHLPQRFDELMLFYIVNRRQRSVPTDLAYRHLQRMLWERGTQWLYDLEGQRGVRLGLAAEVVDQLNGDQRSPWCGRIKMVGEVREEEHVIHDRQMISSVADIFKEKVFEGMPIRELAGLLMDYWNAIEKLYPEPFEEHRAYTLLGTPGVFSLHMLFPSIYARCVRSGVITEERMCNILSGLLMETPEHPSNDFMGPLTIDFWSREHGPAIAVSTNPQDVGELYRHLLTKIQLSDRG